MALRRAAGSEAVVRIASRAMAAGRDTYISAQVVYSGPRSQAQAADLAARLRAPVAASIQWPLEWMVQEPLIIINNKYLDVGSLNNRSDIVDATFEIHFPEHTLDTFSARIQGNVLETFARLVNKSKPSCV